MAIPASLDARRYYRVAKLRHEEGRVLAKADKGNGAVYLGGYAAECMLKALVLSTIPHANHDEILTHNFQALRTTYLQNGGTRWPANISEAFSVVAVWTVERRYDPKYTDPDDANDFLDAAADVINGVDGRL